MDRARTRYQPQIRFAAAGDAVMPPDLGADDVAWRGDERVIQELYEHGLASLCRDEPAELAARPGVAGYTAVTIKSGPHRSVFRIELPSGVVFFKHFKATRWLDVLRNTLIGTPAEREARAARAVADAGIETIACAAVGVESRGVFARDSFLASHAIEHAVPLDSLLRDPVHRSRVTPEFRQELARTLGRLCGRLHRAGLVHRDLHSANLLADVRDEPGGERPRVRIQLKLIDLQCVRRRRKWGPVFRRAARARWDLFGLFNFFRTATRADRCRFLNAYLNETRGPAGAATPSRDSSKPDRGEHRGRLRLAHQIEAFCRRALRCEQLRHDRKWQRSNRRLVVADSAGGRCRGLTILGTDQVLELRANPDTLFRPDRVRLWLRRTDGIRAAVIDLWAAGSALRCEAREITRAWSWQDLLPRRRWSSTRRAWEMAHALRRRGVSTPRMLLYLEARSVSRVREILVGERFGRSVTLPTFLAYHFPGLSARQKETWIRATVRLLAEELARMHEFSLVHQRLSAGDVHVGVDAGEGRVQIAGVERIERRRFSSRRSRCHALGQLDVSLPALAEWRHAHRLRFLKKYLGDHFVADWKSVWRSIDRRVARNARVSRPMPNGTAALRRTARTAALLFALALALTGCQAVERPVSLPVKYEVKCEGDQLLVLSNFKLQKNHELIRELSALREQEAKILDLPLQRDPVVIYLFNDEGEYRKYMAVTYPKLPPRSAYFVGTATELAVFTHWGQSVREDLRHEYTHGLLHSAMKRVPLWLDEGLAEYFEIAGPQPGGINHEYANKLSVLLAQGWRPNLKRLESFDDNAQMRRSDYQEAWAWVHFMLNGSPEAKHVLLSYLADLRKNPDPKSISKRLALECPDFQERSMSYMARLAPERQLAKAL
jgi:Lipopolysaccharide kinase (Kdo/WaaP) family